MGLKLFAFMAALLFAVFYEWDNFIPESILRKMGFKLFIFLGLGVWLLSMFYKCDTFNPESIRRKKVLVTGASSGIGEELAYQYSKLGASVVITARRKELLQNVASKCRMFGANKVEYIAADMALPEERKKVVNFTEKQLGGLDHLVLNHAIYDMNLWLGTPENMTRLSQHMEIDFIAYVDIASRCLKMLTESKGNIGVISSIFGKLPTATTSTHLAPKCAIQGFFATLRQELRLRGADVSVTICVLGYIATDMGTQFADETLDSNELSLVYPSTVNETASAIVKAVGNRERELYFPKHIWYFVTFHKFFPDYVERFTGNMFFKAAGGVSDLSSS